jgi:hypothetical protein
MQWYERALSQRRHLVRVSTEAICSHMHVGSFWTRSDSARSPEVYYLALVAGACRQTTSVSTLNACLISWTAAQAKGACPAFITELPISASDGSSWHQSELRQAGWMRCCWAPDYLLRERAGKSDFS